MKKNKYFSFAFLSLVLTFSSLLSARSVHRPRDPKIPTVDVRWKGEKKLYTLKNSHIEEYPTFAVFDDQHFQDNLLPSEPISYRMEPQKKIHGKVLYNLIDELLEEIDQKKKRYKHFKILKKKDFNRKKKCGLLIVKYKDYPFVVKLFLETPKTFINPSCKGFDNRWFFAMGGGANRHIAGLTRIKNLELIKKRLATYENAVEFDLPRKWFYMPKTSKWLELTGRNIGGKESLKTKLPGTYCIIADAIEQGKTFSIFNKEFNKKALSLCNYLELCLDPHIDNFISEKGSGKLVIIDTEHFPTIVGIKKVKHFSSYTQWYLYLADKCAKDWFFRTKQERENVQRAPHELAMALDIV